MNYTFAFVVIINDLFKSMSSPVSSLAGFSTKRTSLTGIISSACLLTFFEINKKSIVYVYIILIYF
jgi:hypothetical protein